MIREFHGPRYFFLSNFWPARVALDGIEYPTVEHAYQAAKTTLPADRARVRACLTPGQAKRLGRRIVCREDWERVKLGVMRDLVRQKFTRHPALGARLAATHPEPLQEGNSHGDVFWGVDLRTGDGENHLGKILMQVRDELRRDPC